ncbi:hypothetical protein GCM10023080_092200 [Streptomyces pseudoechinosporeus]
MDALEEIGQTFDDRMTGIDDPAELLSAGFRLSARMAESHPELMQVLRRRGLGHLHSDNGLTSRALHAPEAGIASGRFVTLDPAVALTAIGGTLLSLVELRFARPELDGDEAAANLAEMVLRMLGLSPDDAREVARRPLPDLAQPSWPAPVGPPPSRLPRQHLHGPDLDSPQEARSRTERSGLIIRPVDENQRAFACWAVRHPGTPSQAGSARRSAGR